MLRFDVYRDGARAESVDLSGAYVFGQDGIPVRADLAFARGQITCMKRTPGASGLVPLWDAGEPGRLLLPTTRLPDRRKAYNLNLELARARLMLLLQKREDWGLLEAPEAEPLNIALDNIRRRFVEALKCDKPERAAAISDEALSAAINLSERMSLFHADLMLRRRQQAGSLERVGFGCVVDLLSNTDRYRRRVSEAFDLISIPISWKKLAPKEKTYRWEYVDDWVNWAVANDRAIHAGPLVSFDPADVPDWLYIWEHDFEAVREMIYEHIQQVVRRYERKVRLWKVVCGLHAHNSFNLSFEQIMELTRMSCSVVKKLAPRAAVLIELTMPWGEYYARNQRTIPPLLYADMAVQSGVKFDAFGVQLHMGVPQDGLYVRDLMQVSALLDEYIGFGLPVHITAVQAPSDISADAWDAWGGKCLAAQAGHWHVPWSTRLQAEWLQAFCRLAIAKPLLESICWHDLADYEGHYVPHGGLCRNDMEPKLAFKELRNFRAAIMARDLSAVSPPPAPTEEQP